MSAIVSILMPGNDGFFESTNFLHNSPISIMNASYELCSTQEASERTSRAVFVGNDIIRQPELQEPASGLRRQPDLQERASRSVHHINVFEQNDGEDADRPTFFVGRPGDDVTDMTQLEMALMAPVYNNINPLSNCRCHPYSRYRKGFMCRPDKEDAVMCVVMFVVMITMFAFIMMLCVYGIIPTTDNENGDNLIAAVTDVKSLSVNELATVSSKDRLTLQRKTSAVTPEYISTENPIEIVTDETEEETSDENSLDSYLSSSYEWISPSPEIVSSVYLQTITLNYF